MTTNPADDLFALLNTRAEQAGTPAVSPVLDMSAIAALSAALTTTSFVTVPGMARPFLPHQAVCHLYLDRALAEWDCAFVGDDMGLGKTQVMQARIATILAATPGKHALVIAPPVTFGGWSSDLRAAFPGLTIAQIKGRKVEHDADGNVVLPDADVLFLSDDPLTMRAWMTNGIDDRKRFVLTNTVLDAAIIVRDEIHRDKGADGKPGSPTSRAKLMVTTGDACRVHRIPIIGASGTLLTNRPIEALLPLTILGGKRLVTSFPGVGTAQQFAFRYCNPQHNGFGYSYAGCNAARMPEMHMHLRETVYVRREKHDVGNLPHGGWTVQPVALNGKLTRYRRLEEEFLQVVLEEDGPESMWRKARAEALTRMQALWAEAGAAKGDAAVDYIVDQVGVERGRPVIVFYWHEAALAGLYKGLSKVRVDHDGRKVPARIGILNGKVTGQHRTDVVDDFQAGHVDILLAQLKAAGVGVTLTAAADAVFVQVPWSAGDLAQAAGRILRVDQISRDRAERGEGVRWHVLQAAYENGDATFDMAMWDVLERKAKVCDAVNAGKPVTMDDGSVMLAAMRQWFEGRTAR
jgi:SWI/SNF-related matrix-associated actin-dependent regulator of chromatin subfamily A-like protein 1